MMKELTVGELKKALEDVSDDVIVQISSDTGVDQGGELGCIVEDAYEVNYPLKDNETGEETHINYFAIYANYRNEDDECDEE